MGVSSLLSSQSLQIRRFEPVDVMRRNVRITSHPV